MSKAKKTISSLSLEELRSKSGELEAQLFKLRMQKSTGQLANTALIRTTRKELARVKTFQAQRDGKSSVKERSGELKGKNV